MRIVNPDQDEYSGLVQVGGDGKYGTGKWGDNYNVFFTNRNNADYIVFTNNTLIFISDLFYLLCSFSICNPCWYDFSTVFAWQK